MATSYAATPIAEAHGTPPPWGWDYALVFPAAAADEPNPAADLARASALAALRAARFVYSQVFLPAEERVLVRLALPEDNLQASAEAHGLRLRLQPRYGAGFLPFSCDRAHVFENDSRRAAGKPYFAPADRVLLTLATLRSRETWGAGLNVNVLRREGVLLQAFALHSPPERDRLLRKAVFQNWWSPSLALPLAELRDYFGTRVTIYLAWLVFYARMLLGLAGFSVVVTIVLRNTHSKELTAWTRLIFGLALCFWGTYWLEYWKRRNAVLNVQWGTDDFYEANENDIRPSFSGDVTQGFYCKGGFVNLEDLVAGTSSDHAPSVRMSTRAPVVDGEGEPQEVVVIGGKDDDDFLLEAPVTGLLFVDLPMYPYSSKNQLRNRIYVSSLITLFFAICVAVASFLILFYKTQIVNFFGADSIGKFVPGIATALLISVSDPIWKAVSLRLTEWENHRNTQPYENSLIMKRFAFQFVSNYISLFYIALVKPFTASDPCVIGTLTNEPDCMAELGAQLTSLVITKATVQQVFELGVPFVTFRVKKWLQKRENEELHNELSEGSALLSADGLAIDGDLQRSVEEAKMAAYKSTIEDYGEVVIQHGFLVLFGLAFPLAAVIILVNNIVERRTDTYKMLAVQQRADADDAADIGGWVSVLQFLSTASVMTTAALVTMTTSSLQRALPDAVGDVAEKYPAVSFLVFEHVLLWIRWGVGFLVSDVPSSTFRLRARQQFLIAKCFDVGWRPYFRSRTGRGGAGAAHEA